MKLHEVTTSQLKTLWETHKTTVKQDTAIRIHRAFSWLGRAEACHKNDSDIALLCRWAGFNAIYAQWDIDEGTYPTSFRGSTLRAGFWNWMKTNMWHSLFAGRNDESMRCLPVNTSIQETGENMKSQTIKSVINQ